jgi:hypothetical protein
MISRHNRLAAGSSWLRRRLPWTAALLLACLGGAGLVAAVDRPHTIEQRPELSWAADRDAAPWLDDLLAAVAALEPDVTDLSTSVRLILIEVSSAEPTELESHLAAGRAASARLATNLASLQELREAPPPDVEPWRLGEVDRGRLASVDAVLVSAGELAQVWRSLSEQAGLGAELVRALARHDERVLSALRAGREGRWSAAAGELEAARQQLSELAALRSRVDGQAALLDSLLDGQSQHDEALLALYSHAQQGGSVDDAEGLQLRRRVEAARRPVPTPIGTLQAVLSEAVGRELSAGLSTIEAVRGNILAAFDDGESDE